MEEKNLEQLKKLAKVFNTDNVITSAEVEQVLKGILSIMASFRKENVQLTENNKQLYIALLEDIKTEYQKTIETIENKGENLSNAFKIETKKAQDKLEAEITKAQNLVKQLQSIQVKDGKDADEEVIVDKVLEKIKLPEYEEFILDDKGEQIVEEINSLPIEDKYKIDAKHIKNLPEQVVYRGGGVSGIKEIIAGTNITVDNSNLGYPVISSTGGGGGSGSPGGSDTQVQFNDGGSFGGDAGMTYNKTTDTLTLAGAINMESANIEDSDASHYLSIKTTSNLTANRDFTIVPGDAARTLTMAGNINVAANFTTSGANALTLTTTGATNVTLPTTGTLATLIGTESLSNKTLDGAKLVNGGYFADANGNEQIIFNTTTSAINEFTFTNAATGNSPSIAATGGNTDINVNLVPKGAGRVTATGVNIPTISSTDTFTNKTMTASSNVLGGVTMTLGSDATGDIYYRNSGGVLTRLPIGSSTQVLTVSGGLPTWAAAGGGGGSPGGSGSELQYRGGASTFSAVSGSSVSSEGYLTLAPTASTSGTPNLLTLTGPTHTTLTASTEANDVFWDFARTVQFSTGALTNQRAVYITAPTYSFVGASTLTTASTLAISGAPVAGTNATITNAYALDVIGGITHVGGQLAVNGGSAGSPGLYFDLNNTAGFFSSTTGTIGFTASGSSRYTINSTDIRSTGTGFVLPRNLGTDGLMLYTSGDTNTGVGTPGSDVFNIITGGVKALTADASQRVGVGVASGSITAALHIKASTTSTASLRLDAGTAPTSPNEGDLWADSTQKGIVMFANGIKQVSSGTIFTQTANTSVSATTTETTLLGSGVGTLTLPANFWVPSKTIKIKVTCSDIDTDATPGTWTIRGKYGSTTIVSHAGTPTASQTNGTGDTEIILTCRTAGASGTIAGYIKTTYGYTGVSTFMGTTTSTTTVNTTASGAIGVTMQFGNSNAGNNITSLISIVEVIN